MGLFNPFVSIGDSGLFKGYADCHCHMLASADDGIRSVEDTLAFVNKCESVGVREIWFTPHIMEESPLRTADLQQALSAVKRLYRGKLSLMLAAQYAVDELLEERLLANDLLMFPQRRLLLETPLYSAPDGLLDLVNRLRMRGCTPVFVHPERYVFMDDAFIAALKEKGSMFQLDIVSLVSFYGDAARLRAEELLEKDIYDLSGSGLQRSISLEDLLASKLKYKIIKHIPRI